MSRFIQCAGKYALTISSCTAFFVGALWAESQGFASPEDAAEAYSEGLQFYVAKDYAAAAEALQRSYNEKNNQDTLFAWAQAERLMGNCKHSRKLFSDYIAKGANANQSRAAFSLMEDCVQREPKTEPEPPPKPPKERPVTPQVDSTSSTQASLSLETQARTDSWYRDWIGMSLITSGVVGLVASGVSYSSALRSESDGAETDYDTFLSLKGQAENRRTLATITGILGGVLLSGGITYYLLKTPTKKETGVALQIDTGSAALTFSSEF